MNNVRPSGLVGADVILDAIKEQTEKRDMDLRYRGFLSKEVDIDWIFQNPFAFIDA